MAASLNRGTVTLEEPIKDEKARNEKEEQAYKDYCKAESDEAYTLICKNEEEYDKQLLTLSTGMLAILFAFLKDIVRLDSAIYRPLLYLALASLAGTVATVIISFQVSIVALEQVRTHWKKHYDGDRSGEFPETLSKVVKYVNRTAGIMFVFGISLAVLFITTNLSHQAHTKEISMRTNLQEGSPLKSSIVTPENRGALTKAPVQSAPKPNNASTGAKKD